MVKNAAVARSGERHEAECPARPGDFWARSPPSPVPRFDYPCPDCRTRNSLHDTDCRFEGVAWSEVEDAYLDTVGPLSAGVVAESDLIDGWPDDGERLRRAALGRLKTDGRVDETGGRLRLRTAAEFREEIAEPDVEPIRTVYRQGSVPGCHDNAVFAMIAWYEMVGLSWAETTERVVAWLRDTGAWDRGGFEEASPEALVETKRHVYESGYGWKEKARAAKRVIEGRR